MTEPWPQVNDRAAPPRNAPARAALPGDKNKKTRTYKVRVYMVRPKGFEPLTF